MRSVTDGSQEGPFVAGGTKYGATDGPRGTIRGAIYGPRGPSVLPRTVRRDSI